MNNGELDTIKSDMTFYLDKMFQFSFVYVAAVFAALAGTKVRVVCEISKLFSVNELVIVFAGILLLNLLYLTLAGSCGFAVLKRVDFILAYGNSLGNGGNALVGWERFTRGRKGLIRSILWNIDNHFTALIYFVVATLSFPLFKYCWCHSKCDSNIHFFLIFLGVLYLVPVIALLQTVIFAYRLSRIPI